MNSKICTKCLQEQPATEFSSAAGYKDGLRTWCKQCTRENSKKNHQLHLEQRRAWQRQYDLDHKEEMTEYRIQHKDEIRARQKEYDRQHAEERAVRSREWRATHIDQARQRARELQRKSRAEDPLFRLKHNLRSRLNGALTKAGYLKRSKFSEYLGCTVDELKVHLEKQFQAEMIWSNYGKGLDKWNVDHVVPLDSAMSEQDMYKLCHYTNLQPLWEPDNLRKGNKMPNNLIISA